MQAHARREIVPPKPVTDRLIFYPPELIKDICDAVDEVASEILFGAPIMLERYADDPQMVAFLRDLVAHSKRLVHTAIPARCNTIRA